MVPPLSAIAFAAQEIPFVSRSPLAPPRHGVGEPQRSGARARVVGRRRCAAEVEGEGRIAGHRDRRVEGHRELDVLAPDRRIVHRSCLSSTRSSPRHRRQQLARCTWRPIMSVPDEADNSSAPACARRRRSASVGDSSPCITVVIVAVIVAVWFGGHRVSCGFTAAALAAVAEYFATFDGDHRRVSLRRVPDAPFSIRYAPKNGCRAWDCHPPFGISMLGWITSESRSL